jgi:putative thioredoxin
VILMDYEVTDFQKEVIERSHEVPVVADFWAEWCAPCRILGPVLKKLAEESGGRWVLAKVNTEVHKEPTDRYRVRSIPNVKLFVNGNVAAEFVGALPEPLVRRWLAKVLPSRFEKTVALAEQLLREEKIDAARNLLSDVVQQEPSDHKARILLAQTYQKSEPERAEELVRPIEEDSQFYEMAEAIRTMADLFRKKANPALLPEADVKPRYISAIEKLNRNDFEGALEEFIGVIREDRYYDNDGARKACIAIFKLLGDEHELTQKYRREFSSALYV